MIIKGISYKWWEKVLKNSQTFFLCTAIIFPIATLLFYLFASDFEYSLTKKAPYLKKAFPIKDNQPNTQMHFFSQGEEHIPYIPLPDITKNIFFTGYNYRPDAGVKNSKMIALSTKNSKLYAKEEERIYLNCKDLSDITFSKTKTPYSLIPLSIKKNKLLIQFDVKYKGISKKRLFTSSKKIHLDQVPEETTKLSISSIKALKSLLHTSFYLPDKLITLMGGKEYTDKKNLKRLHFNKNGRSYIGHVKQGDLLSFVDGDWKQNIQAVKDQPLFKITSINKSQLCGAFWNESGFYQKEITIPLAKIARSNIHSFSFDKVYKRNNESVICKIKGRTFLLKPHDWLVQKNSSWHLVKNISELNSLIELEALHELIIFEGIVKEKNQELFTGYIFDTTRSNYKKLQIPLKKKETTSYNR